MIADGREIVYKITEVGCSIKALESNYCSLVANICRMAEALTGMLWTGRMTGCNHLGCEHCKVIKKPGDDKFIKEDLSNRDYRPEHRQLIENIALYELLYPRKKLGEHFHMSLHQLLNYILLQASPGHKIIYRHSGVKAGEELGELKPAENMNQAIENLATVFKQLRLGLLTKDDETIGKTILKLEESVFSAGIKNINRKLDDYTTGIIQGYLSHILNQTHEVTETKCQANGDPYCEFTVKTA